MAFYIKNKEALEKRKDEEWIRDLLEALEKVDGQSESIFDVADVAGKKVLCANVEGGQLQLDSLYDSDVFLDMWYKGQKRKVGYKTKVFFYGLGNGMYVRKMLGELPEDGLLFVYEPTVHNLDFLFRNFEYQSLLADKRLILLAPEMLKKKLNSYFTDKCTYPDMPGMIVQHYLNYNRLYETDYYDYMNELQIAVRSINSTQNVFDRYGKRYFQNSIENLPYLYNSKSLHELSKRIPEGLPAIIVAAGPSLDKNVEELRAAKDKALIIAVDSSIRVLLKHGIIPDLVMSIDGVKMTSHFDYPGVEEVPLVCLMTTNCQLVDKHHGMSFFTNDLNIHLEKFFQKHRLLLPLTGSGGSVANSAMSLAQIMDMKTIILVGQDLAYTDNKTHSVDSVRGSWGEDASKKEGMMVEGYDGKPIWSSTEFELYRIWIEEEIMTNPTLKLINATEGGAKIKGAIQMTLRDAIATECTESYNMKEIVQGCVNFFSEEQKADFEEYINKLPEELDECLHKVQSNKRLYQKMQELIYTGKYHSNEMKRLSAQTTEYNDYLDNALVMEYVNHLIHTESSEVLHNLHRVNEDEREDLKTITKSTLHFLETMEQGILDAKKYIEDRLPAIWEKAKQELN